MDFLQVAANIAQIVSFIWLLCFGALFARLGGNPSWQNLVYVKNDKIKTGVYQHNTIAVVANGDGYDVISWPKVLYV